MIRRFIGDVRETKKDVYALFGSTGPGEEFPFITCKVDQKISVVLNCILLFDKCQRRVTLGLELIRYFFEQSEKCITDL